MVEYRIVYKTKTIVKHVDCHICTDGEDPDFCLAPLPEYDWWDEPPEKLHEQKYRLLRWVDYAAKCLGVAYQDMNPVIFNE